MTLGKYIKKAFLNNWNLLLFLGGLGFAALSGQPDVAIPLVLAGETAYLGYLGTHPKFQKYVDAQEHKSAREASVAGTVDRLLAAMPPEQVRRFESLRRRCVELRQIARDLQASQGLDALGSLEDLQLSDLDRLLWIHLRMLYTQTMLERFLKSTDERQINAEIKRLEQRIAAAPSDPTSPASQRILPALQESLATSRARLANLQMARENAELLQVEIEGLENKIKSITELAINRHDPGEIAGQVDQIAQGLVRTEQTMNELQFATGADPFGPAVPSILAQSFEDALNSARFEPTNEELDDQERLRRRAAQDGIRFE